MSLAICLGAQVEAPIEYLKQKEFDHQDCTTTITTITEYTRARTYTYIIHHTQHNDTGTFNIQDETVIVVVPIHTTVLCINKHTIGGSSGETFDRGL